MKPEMKSTLGQWIYLSCKCFVRVGRGISVQITYECQACGNTNLRFVHTLEHVVDNRQIQVGIECATILVKDAELPRLAENEVKRKERWRQEYRKPGRCVATIDDLKKRGQL